MKRTKLQATAGAVILALILSMTGCRTDSGIQNEVTEAPAEMEKESETDQVEALGRYVETQVVLPGEGVTYPRTMNVLADGKWAYFDGMAGYFLSEDEGASWQLKYSIDDLMSDLMKDKEEEPYFLAADISAEGSLAVVAADFVDLDNLGAVLRIVDHNGEFYTASGLLAERDYLMGLKWRGEELYGFTGKSNVCRIDMENQELKKLFTSAERAEVIAFQGENMLLLENGGVEIYNLRKNQLEAADEVLNDFVDETFDGFLDTMGGSEVGLLVPDGEDAVYIVGTDGIFRHILGGTAIEQVVDGRFSGLGTIEPGLSSFIPYKNGEFLVLTTTAGLIRMSYDSEEASRPDNVLKVYSLYEMERIRQAIGIYQKQNPDIWVDYQIGISEDSAIVLSDALKNLNMELAAGTGPDVLILDGMDENVYIEKDTLMELGAFAETLTAEDELISNILEANYREEELYVIPAAFGVPLLVGRTEDLEKIHDMESLVQTVERLSETASQSVTGSFNMKQELAQLLSVYSDDFLDGKQVDREELIRFLAFAKRIYQANMRNITAEFQENFGHVDIAKQLGSAVQFLAGDLGKISYGIAADMMFDLGAVEAMMLEGDYQMKLFDENNTGFVPTCKLAVSALSQQPQLAEDFLRVVLGEEAQRSGYYDGFPINKTAFLEMCTDQDNEMSYGGAWRLPDGREIRFFADYPPRELTQELENMVDRLNHAIEQNSFMKEAILEVGTLVLLGDLTAEEGAEEIERNVALYLAE